MKNILVFGLLWSINTFAAGFGLDGRWKSECQQLPKRHSIQTLLDFTLDRVHIVTFLFADNQCKSLNLMLHQESVYSVGTSLGEGVTFDYVPLSVELTLLRSDVVAFYNENPFAACGLSDWTLNQPKSVAGLICSGNQMPTIGTTIFDLVKMSSNQLQFADFAIRNGNTDKSKRPIQLDPSSKFVRE